MKNFILFVFLGSILVLLPACSNKERTGAVVGSVVGAVIGSRFGKGHGRLGFSLAGSLLGSHIGGSVGRQMDTEDYHRTRDALEHSRTGHVTRWHNRRTNRYYAYTPRRTYYDDEIPCREFVMETYYRGRIEEVIGTACRQPDGSWRMLK